MDLLHNIIYGLMFFCVFLAVLISVERFIFISNNLKRSRLVAKTIKETPNQHLNNLSNDFVSQVVKSVESLYSQATKLDVVQDRTDALYIDLRQELYKKLWMLDTIITAAPLLGLLGTIFGIVDTFLALSSSGMSDPSGVSAGIGTALYATAFGIALALISLIVFNFLNTRNELILENIKFYLLFRSS